MFDERVESVSESSVHPSSVHSADDRTFVRPLSPLASYVALTAPLLLVLCSYLYYRGLLCSKSPVQVEVAQRVGFIQISCPGWQR